jgi:hypothetical protein
LEIAVEQIIAAVETIEIGEPIFHEEIANQLAARFPGNHTLQAVHHGVEIVTTRQSTLEATP